MPAKRIVSNWQWEVLLGHMEKNRSFANGSNGHDTPLEKQQITNQWAELAVSLNSDETGCTKTGNQWREKIPLTGAERQRRFRERLIKENPEKLLRIKKANLERTKNKYKKYWTNEKYEAREKEVIRRAQARASSDGSLPEKMHSLSDEEERVLAILGSVNGVQAVPNDSTALSDEEISYQDPETCYTPLLKKVLTESRIHRNTNDIDTGEEPPQHTPSIQEEKLTESFFVPFTNSINTAETPLQRKQEEWEIFGKAVGIQMRNLDKTQLAITQKIISDTIYYAKFGMLTQKSHLKL